MTTNQDKLAIENMELKAELHEIKIALGITQDYGSESTPLKRIAEVNKMRESVRDALDINGAYFISNETSAMIRAIAKLQEAKELAQLAAEGHSESLSAIAAQLGVGFDGDVQTIFSAIHRLKLRAVNDDSECYRAVDLLDAIAKAFGYEYVDSPQSRDTLLGAIAKLKSNLSLANESLRGIADRLDLDRFDDEQVAVQIEALKDGADPVAKQNLLAIAHSLELGYFNREEALAAIANLKHSLQLSQNEVKELQKKSAIADQLQSDLINTDIGEIRSERDYYRGILDKLCDRLNVPNIEALEHAAKYQEMDLDFTAQHNDDLRGKLVASQAMNLTYLNRIVELESEVRSLKEPLPESDRLTNAELIQIVRSLIKP